MALQHRPACGQSHLQRPHRPRRVDLRRQPQHQRALRPDAGRLCLGCRRQPLHPPEGDPLPRNLHLRRPQPPDVSTGRTTLYLGNVEIVTEAGITTSKRTIAGILLQQITGGVASNQYLFHDHLGSLVRITDASGTAWPTWTSRPPQLQLSDPVHRQRAGQTTRGFTGHETVDGSDVIHMNARLYDPLLGRFLQADPLIQAPGNLQSWNAYTYVFNNPLRYTDPTGMLGQEEGSGWGR